MPSPTRVVNLRNEPFDVYIGRAGHGYDGYFGNPFRGRPTDVAIALFTGYFRERINNDPKYRAAIHALEGKTLGCFCKPDACHGDVIVAYLAKCRAQMEVRA